MNQIKTYIILFFFFVLVFSGLLVKSQDTLSEIYVKRHYFSVDVGRFILNEARFSLEIEKNVMRAHGFNFGIKYKGIKRYGLNDLYAVYGIPFYYRVTKGVYFGYTATNITGKKNRVYLTFEPSIGYYYYNDINYHTMKESSPVIYNESAKFIKLGVSYMVRYKFGVNDNKYGGAFGDIFIGLGLMLYYMDFDIYSEEYAYKYEPNENTTYQPPKKETYIFPYPLIRLGMHLGFYSTPSQQSVNKSKKRRTHEPKWKFQLYQD